MTKRDRYLTILAFLKWLDEQGYVIAQDQEYEDGGGDWHLELMRHYESAEELVARYGREAADE